MADVQPPLNYEDSASTSHPELCATLPPEVIACLKNARFLHLATCHANQPHVSLMNYTYLPSTPFSPLPTIIMTTNPSSRKTLNLLQNPSVSLLVHDWVSHRAPTATLPSTSSHRHQRPASPPSPSSPSEVSPNTNGAPLSPQHPSTTTTTGGGGGGGPHRSSLANLLLNLNSSSLSSISATINGTAELVEPGTRQEAWLKQRHLENHMLPEGGMGEEGDGGRGCFIEGEEVRVVVVGIRDGRIADWKGGVRDWVITGVGDGR